MPNTKNKTTLSSLPVVDLAYAVGRLVEAGKTTAAEVLALAADRGQRIAALQAELSALREGEVVTAPAAKRGGPAAKRARKVAPRKRPAAAKPAPTKSAAAPAKPHFSAKLREFRRVQGLYAGYLRGFTGAARERIRTINAEKGPAAALAEMKKLPAAKGAPKKVAPAKKVVAPKPSSPKELRMTAKRRAQLKVHGAYIGMMRGLADAEKARIKAIAKEKGMGAAIEVMKKGEK